MRVVSVGINNLGKILLLTIGFNIGLLIPILWMPTLIYLIVMPFLLYLLLISGWIYSRIRASALEKIEIRRILPKRVLNGDLVEVVIEIVNNSFVGIYNVQYIDYYPETVKLVEGFNSGSIIIPPHSTVKILSLIHI